jgi:hypothetical protein
VPDAETEVLGPVADRGSGTVLAAVHAGREALIRRLVAEPDARARARMALLAQRLVGLDGPALLPVVAVHSRWDVLDVVYDAPPLATSLAALAARRNLTPGEVLYVGLALADGLTALESTGHTHGRLTAADVLLTPDGAVLLTGYGIAGVLGSGGSMVEDVQDLRGLLGCLDESGRLAGHLEASQDACGVELERGEGSAAAFAAVLRTVPQQAIAPRLPGRPAGLPLARPPARSTLREKWSRLRVPLLPRLGWRVLGGALPAALGVLLLAGWLGASLGPPPPEEPVTAAPSPSGTASPPISVPTPTLSPGDWRGIVDELNARRARLLAAPAEGRLRTVDAVGSSAYAADHAIVRSLRARSASGVDVRTELVSVDVRTAGSDRADLTVVDVLRPYTIRGADDQVLVQRNGRGERTTDVVLVRTDDGWRVAQVSPG